MPEIVGGAVGVTFLILALRSPLPLFLRHVHPEKVAWHAALVFGLVEVLVVGASILHREGLGASSGLRRPPHRAIWILRAALPVLAFVVASLPAANAWQDGRGGYFALGGLLPWSDASNYYAGAVEIDEYGRMDDWNKRRPLNATINSLKLFVGRNLEGWIGVNAVLMALGLSLAAREVSLRMGYCAAAAFMAIVCGHGPGFWATTMSETNGHFLGLLATAVLLAAVRMRDHRWCLTAVFAFTIALDSRAGAFLVLPFLWPWCAVSFADTMRRRVQIAAAAVLVTVLGFLPAKGYASLLAEGRSASHANFSWTLYGLADGNKGWREVFADYPQIKKMDERQRADFVYARAFDRIRRDPGRFLAVLCKSTATFVRYLGAYVNLSTTFAAAALILCLLSWRDPLSWLIMAGLAGTIASAPLLMLDGGSRVFAATVPVTALAGALVIGALAVALVAVLTSLVRRGESSPATTENSSEVSRQQWVPATAIILVGMFLAGPLAFALPRVRSTTPPAPRGRPTLTFVPGRSGEWLDVDGQHRIADHRVPRVWIGDLMRDIRATEIHDLTLNAPPLSFGIAVPQGGNPANGDPMTWFVTPTGLQLPRGRRALLLVGEDDWTRRRYHFLRVTHVFVLSGDGRTWSPYPGGSTGQLGR